MYLLEALMPYVYAVTRAVIYALPVLLMLSGTFNAYLAILRYRFAKREGKSHKGTYMFAVRAALYLSVAAFLANNLYFH